MTAGPWLRLTTLAATAGVAAVVATGQWGLAHDVTAHVTVALLAAVVLTARIAYPALLAPAAGAFALFGLAGISALAGAQDGLHLALGGLALAAAAVAAALAFRRGAPASAGSWRDYVTLTKPRIMSLLLLTGGAGVFVGAGGVPGTATFVVTMVGLALACGGASALNHYLDRDIDPLMGKRTAARPVASGRMAAMSGSEWRKLMSIRCVSLTERRVSFTGSTVRLSCSALT